MLSDCGDVVLMEVSTAGFEDVEGVGLDAKAFMDCPADVEVL